MHVDALRRHGDRRKDPVDVSKAVVWLDDEVTHIATPDAGMVDGSKTTQGAITVDAQLHAAKAFGSSCRMWQTYWPHTACKASRRRPKPAK